MNAAVRALRQNQSGTFALQITSMIDMFTIILVFLLKSYSSSVVDMAPMKDLRLPSSTATVSPVEALKLAVSKDGIYVDDKSIVVFENGQLPKSATDASDTRFIKPLFEALNTLAQKSKNIAKQNENVTFDGKIVFQADQSLNYQLIKKVMYTATIAGYSDFKFAVVAQQ
ncbi:MAG: biopolymer transporter ExbD [Oligoflexia bacterium]|nr:biopolymer transporter ExbD [Oligoflexia bacterium]